MEKTEQGIYVVSNDLVDLGKKIDDRYTQIQRSKYLGLLKNRTIYVPDEDVPKKRRSGLAAVAVGAVLLAGCASNPFKTQDVYVEHNRFGDELKTHQTRAELTQDGKKTFVAEHQEGDYTKASAKRYVDMPGVFKGHVTVFGESRHDSDKVGFGGDFDGKLENGLILGGTAEQNQDNVLQNLYTGKELGDSIAKVGVAKLNNQTVFQGMLGHSIDTKNGGYCFGIGGIHRDVDKDGHITGYARRFNKEKGKGYGWDAWLKSDLEGNTVTKARAALRGAKFGKSFAANDITGLGLNALSVVPNVIERLPFDAFCGDTVMVGKYIRDGTEKQTASLVAYNNFGDLSSLKNIRLGIKGTRSENSIDKTKSTIITPSLGFDLGPLGVWYEVDLQRRNAPNHFVSMWFSFSDFYKWVKGE